MEHIHLRDFPYGDIAARVEDRLALPLDSVRTVSTVDGYHLQISANLNEEQRKRIKEFLAFYLA